MDAKYFKWLQELNKITNNEMGLSLQDLPDAATREAFENGTSAEDAYQDFCSNIWEDLAPLDAPSDLEERFDAAMRYADREEYEPGSDADPGL